MVEQWNSGTGTVWWNSGKIWQNSGTVTVEQSNSDGTKWVVEQWNGDSGTVLRNSDGGTVRWNNRIVMVEQCGKTVEV